MVILLQSSISWKDFSPNPFLKQSLTAFICEYLLSANAIQLKVSCIHRPEYMHIVLSILLNYMHTQYNTKIECANSH